MLADLTPSDSSSDRPQAQPAQAQPIIDATACFYALWNNRLYGMYIMEVIEDGKDFRFLAFNDAIYQQQGIAEASPVPLKQLLGQRLSEALPADIAHEYHQHYAQCVHSGHIVEFETHLKGSTDTWWNLSIDPVKDASGKIYQLIVTVADTTAKRSAERSLHTSRQVLQQVIDAMPLSVVWKDFNSVYQGCNLPFAKVAGFERAADVAGKTDYDMVWKKEEADWFRKCDRQVMDSGKAELNIIEPQLQSDGKQAWLSTSKIPLRDSSGNVTGVLVMFEDITDQKDAQEQQQRLLAILEATPDVVGITDAVGNHHYLNRAGQILFNISPEQTHQFHLSDITRPDIADMLIKEALPIAIENGSWHGESIILDCQGREIPVSQVIICHKTEEEKVAYFSSITRDISDRKAAETLLKDTANRQGVLNQITAQISNSLDLDTVIATTLMSLHQGLKLDYCAFAWLEDSANSTSGPTWRVVQAVDDTDHGIPLGDRPNEHIEIDFAGLVRQEFTQTNDASECPDAKHKIFLERLGICSEMLVPVRTDANKTGVIICYHVHQVHPWSPAEVELLQAVGNQLAIAINQANLYTQSCLQSQQLTTALNQLKRTQAQIIQAEKMSSLGQMVAGVAHEINNPVNFIHGNLEPAQGYTQDLLGLIELYQKTYTAPTPEIEEELETVDLDFVREDLPKLLNSMVVGTDRIREIVLSLRNFSRLDEAAVKTVDLHEGINSTLVILSHRLKCNGCNHAIQVIKQYGDLPKVDCYPSQLNQVFMNIFANAIDALDDHPQPQLTITTEFIGPPSSQPNKQSNEQQSRAIIRIADNGPGIPSEIQPQILDPFFTTKPVGKGTGMGMSISYQIITEKHLGELTFTSAPGQGTEFIIDIPIYQPEAT